MVRSESVPAQEIPSPDEDDLTPDSMNSDSTPAHVEVFDLQDESSSESVTPEMDPHVLFIKLKEVWFSPNMC